MPSYLQKGPTLSLPANKTTQTNVAFSLGNGSDVDFTVTPPTGFSYVYVNTIYRTDWQGTVELSASPRTNLIKQSCQLDDVAWTKGHTGTGVDPVVTANVGLAPDGTLTADRVVFALNGSVDSSQSYISSSLSSYTSGISYVSSIWLKTEDGSTKNLTLVIPEGYGKNIVVTGAWNRFTFARTATSTNTGNLLVRLRYSENRLDSVTVLMWGGQVETGTVATSFIPTTTAPVTVTDYTVSGLTYTLSETPLDGAVLSYSGYSYTAAYATFDLPNCGSISISASGITSGKLRITASVDGTNFNPAVILPIDEATGALAASSDLPNGFYTLNVKPFKSVRFTQTDVTDTVTISTALGR